MSQSPCSLFRRSAVFFFIAAVVFGFHPVGFAQTVPVPSMDVTCTPNPIYVNSFTTCIVHVQGGASGAVSFYALNTFLATVPLDSSGKASVSSNFLNPPPGAYQVTVVYSGDSHYSPMTQTTGVTIYSGQVIVANDTLICSPWMLNVGVSASCTVHVPGGATGSVAFSISGSPWGTVALDANGFATVSSGFANAAPGPYTVTAAYLGDGNFAPLTTSTTMMVYNGAVALQGFEVGCSPAIVPVGSTGQCTAHAIGGATGTVDFIVGGSLVGSATLDGYGNATLPNMFAGFSPNSYGVEAMYEGGANFLASSAATTVQVSSSPSSPSIFLSCLPPALMQGNGTNCKAQIPIGATGNIHFFIAGVPWAIVPVGSDGSATAISGLYDLPIGNYAVVAYYPGDSNYAEASAGISVAVSATKVTPNVNLSCSPSYLAVGSLTTCSVHVDSGATGDVSLSTPSGTWADLGLDSYGNAVFSGGFSGAAAGNYQLTAIYSGDINNNTASKTIPIVVSNTQAASQITANCSPTTATNTDLVSCSAQVGGGASGTVTFSVLWVQWSVQTLTQSGAALAKGTFAGVPPGAYPILISYSGDANYSPSSITIPITIVAQTTSPSSNVYCYSITQPTGDCYSDAQQTGAISGYAPNGNILAYNDSVNGQWSSINYDALNRLTSATVTPMTGPPQSFCWDYDDFGNRTSQATSPSPFAGVPGDLCSTRIAGTLTSNAWVHYNTSNQATDSSQSAGPNSLLPDAAGNMTFDGQQHYLYDGEGRVCAVFNVGGGLIGYLYNAEGQRVAKGAITQFSCDLATNGFTLTNEYLQDANGGQLTEFDGQGTWLHTNVSANGQLVATYNNDGQGVHFQLADWLGTRRVQTDYAGNPELQCQSLPFGDAQNCAAMAPNAADATENHFTDKERDAESGNDYFGARYYGSTMGRLLSPDPETATPLHLLNPQRWNMYSYGLNNPLSFTDAGGRDAAAVNFSKEIAIVGHQGIMSVHSDGTVVYARFGPKGGNRPTGPGEVKSFTLTTKVQFDSDGRPTPDSLNAVKKELGTSDVSPEKGQDPSSIRLNYFKVGPSETANLDQWIKQQQLASDHGQYHGYDVSSTNCTWFCARGLVAASVIDQNQANHADPSPNGFWWQLLQLQSRGPCFQTSTDDHLGNVGASGCQ